MALEMVGDGHQKLLGPDVFAPVLAEDMEAWLGEVQGRVAAGARKPALPGSRAGGGGCCRMPWRPGAYFSKAACMGVWVRV